MAADMDYFRRCIREDPSFEVKHAIVDYLSGNFDEAKEVADQLCDECFNDPDGKLLSSDEAYEIIENMTPVDAYWMGRFSCNIDDGFYYRIDGYGHFEEVIEPWDFLKDILYAGWENIVNGEVEISDDLQAVIDLFDDGHRSNNRKSAPKKKPAKSQCVKRNASNGKGNTKKPASKASQSNNRKPRTTTGNAPAKKPANRRR